MKSRHYRFGDDMILNGLSQGRVGRAGDRFTGATGSRRVATAGIAVKPRGARRRLRALGVSPPPQKCERYAQTCKAAGKQPDNEKPEGRTLVGTGASENSQGCCCCSLSLICLPRLPCPMGNESDTFGSASTGGREKPIPQRD